MKSIISTILILFTTVVMAQDVSITVYNQNIGLVKEVREVQLKSGETTLEITDVAAQIDPTSVHLKLEGVEVLDQDFEYDLVSRERLLEKYLDQQIQVFTEQGEMFEGVLLSASGSQLILQSDNGQVQIVSPDAVRDVRFGELPGGLRTRPTLVWSMFAKKSGKQDAELSYLTSGMTWHTEYVAVTQEKGDFLEISSWVSVDNRSGATYEDAKLKLMAGDVRVEAPRGGRARNLAVFEKTALAADAPSFEEKAFFEYHMYTLQRPTTLKDRQTKQIALFSPAKVSAKREYVYHGQRDQKKVNVNLVFKNEEKAGLGIPLPAGKVRVYQEDSDGALEFVGEDRIEHTPKDEDVRLVIGSAFDIVAEREMTDTQRITKQVREETYRIKLRNHKDEDVIVTIVESVYGDWDVLEKSHEFEKKNARTIEFKVAVKSGKETVITYRVRRK